MMQPDPQRSWFVYYQDKELGPLPETELKVKFASGEIQLSAYLFTEGMSDWTPANEVGLFSGPDVPAAAAAPASPTASAASGTHSGITTTAAAPSPTAASNPIKTESISKVTTVIGTKAKASAPAGNRMAFLKNKRYLVYGGIAAAVLGVLAMTGGDLTSLFGSEPDPFANQAPIKRTHRPPGAPGAPGAVNAAGSPVPGASGAPAASGAPGAVAAASPGASGAPKAGAPAATPPVGPVDELLSLRTSQDSSGPPYRFSTQPMNQPFPVLLGAVSPLIGAQTLKLAIYSDPNKSISPIPYLWRLQVPVIDGLFSAGPLHVDGKALPAGRYIVLTASGNKLLGETSFDVPGWPATEKLLEMQNDAQKQRVDLGDKERAALAERVKRYDGLFMQLRSIAKYADKGPKGAKDWPHNAKIWWESYLKLLQEQRAVLSRASLYPTAQKKFLETLQTLNTVFQAHALSAKQGPKAVLAQYKVGLGQLWARLDSSKKALDGELIVAASKPPEAVVLNLEEIKAQLTGQGGT